LAREVVVDLRELMALARSVIAEPADADSLAVPSSQLAGDLLPDWYDDWVLLERERLRQLRVHALELIGRRAMERGRYGRAIDAALTALLADPLRESTHALLIELHLAEGNRIAAMRQYEGYCERTRAAGLEPVDELRELAESAVTRR
jgi:two-component SAPR family response regulator